MPNKRFLLMIGVLCGSAAALAAQEATCSGPGAAFGVTSYQCASCGVRQGAGTRTKYVFQAEPIILEATLESVLKPGDVIVAVNGEPIMTQAGSDQFTYPEAAKTVITVRRGDTRMELTAPSTACRALPDIASNVRSTDPLVVVDGVVVPSIRDIPSRERIETVEVLRGYGAAVLYKADPTRAVIVIKTKRGYTSITPLAPPTPRDTSPLIIVDGVVQSNAREADVNQSAGGRRFGFAISCLPSCTRAKASDGTEYYKFDGYPPIAALTPGGPAERAGIRVGDLVAQIDGQSILGEEGALRFLRANRKDSMNVTVMRGRAMLAYLLKSR